MKKFLYFIIAFTLIATARAQVAIKTDGSAPHNSAMLDINATDRGLLIPRISSANRDLIPSPATGLLIYNTTTNLFNYYNGSYWYQLEATFISSTIGTLSAGGGVSINFSPGAVPENSAVLDINDPTRGILIPRTTPDLISTPATGLLIYNSSSNQLNYYNGVQWVEICSAPVGVSGATGNQTSAGVAYNNNNSAPHHSAILDVSATDKGILIPRLTNIQRSAILPVTGLVVYNTNTNNIEFYDGLAWQQMVGLEPPSVGTHVPDTTQITWNWNAVIGAAGYKWGLANDYATATDMGTSTSITETGLICFTPYTRYIWSYNSCGHSTATVLTSITLSDLLAPPTPGAHVPSLFQIVWKWNPVPGAAGYKWGVANNYLTASDMGTDTLKTETGLACGTLYSRYIWAYTNCGASTPVSLTQATSSTAPPPPPPTTDTAIRSYYASPNGTGTGTYSSPFRIADFWAVANAGDTLNLMNGHYTGDSSMITPPENLSGTALKRIVIRAMNDGMADIDGQGQNAPVELNYNNYFTLEGFNAHHAGSATAYSVSVVFVNYSSYNILRRICAWEATDGNTNVFGIHNGEYNLLEDCAGWGTARKTFSNSQQGNYTTFRRCFGRWEGSHTEGPKKTFGVSYNSYNALLENCIGTWDGLKMQQTYELHDGDGNGVGQFFSNYEVQQPDGIFSHDGFDVLPDTANARLYGCIAYIKANQRYHNSFKKWAAPFAFEIKGIDIKNSLSSIQPGSYTDIWNVNLASVGNTTTNSVSYLTQIGGEPGHISSDWNPQNIVTSATCNGINTGTVITKRYIDGVLTNHNLWPWPMNQRIINAMTQGGYTPIDITGEIYGLCGDTPPPIDIVAVAKQWLAFPTGRDTLEHILDSWVGNIDSVIQLVKPVPAGTQTGEIFYQSFTDTLFQQKYPNHQYHMYVPAHYNASSPIGLMLWLHGGGSWDSTEIHHIAQYDMDNEQVTGRSYPRTETDNSNYILVAPIAPFGSAIPHPLHASRWNVPNADQYLMDIITELSAKYNIDYNRIVVAGFSMGGVGAYHQALRLNDRLAAVMASAGGWKLGTWDGLKNMPMYLIHGVNDAHYDSLGCREHYTPIEYARVAHNLLSQSSNIHQLYEYPGQHPWDDSAALYWQNFINGQQGWVTDKVRNPYRSNVTAVNPWRSYDVGSYCVSWTENPSPHTMWVTIRQTGTDSIPYDYARIEGTGGCSSLADFNNWSLHADTKNMPGGKAEANITGQNQITVTSANVTRMSLWLHPDMVNFNNPVSVTLNGVTRSYNLRASLLTALKSYERRWDWGMIYHTEIDIY